MSVLFLAGKTRLDALVRLATKFLEKGRFKLSVLHYQRWQTLGWPDKFAKLVCLHLFLPQKNKIKSCFA